MEAGVCYVYPARRPGPVYLFCVPPPAALLLVAPLLPALSSCPSSPLACSLFRQAPTALRFVPGVTTVPVARRSLPRLAPPVRASPRGTACIGTPSCSVQAPNVVPVKGGFCGAPALPGSIGPAACIAGTRCAAFPAPSPPPVATYTSGKTPGPRRSPAAPALSAPWYPPRLRPPYAFILPCLVAHFVRSFALSGRKKGAAVKLHLVNKKISGRFRVRLSYIILSCLILPSSIYHSYFPTTPPHVKLSSQSTRPPQTRRWPLC